jgi:hypothetical protein
MEVRVMKELMVPICGKLSASHIIGVTVSSLRKAGMREEMREFIALIKRKDIDITSIVALEMARQFVNFC